MLQRVLQSAKVQGVTGSLAKRDLTIAAKKAALVETMSDIFISKDKITKKDVVETYKTLMPGVNIKIKSKWSSIFQGGYVSEKYNKKSISGYKVSLPFDFSFENGKGI
jgi:hypothetical protein